jgi:acid stress-induced BolA-like protein IbaG/YrbA
VTNDELQQLLEAGLADCTVRVAGDGYQYEIEVVGERFAGLNAVKRQQTVYAVLNDVIRSGQVHAVNIRALTPDEA